MFDHVTGWCNNSAAIRVTTVRLKPDKEKYPPKIVIPCIPDQLPLFWASLFGEFPSKIADIVRRDHTEPLEIQDVDFNADKLTEIMAGNVLFPRRLTQYGLSQSGRSRPRGDASVYFMDALASPISCIRWPTP